MADDLDFESFDNLDDLDWSELEKDIKESAKEESADASEGTRASGGTAASTVADVAGHVSVDYLLDVNLQVTVEVGRRQYFISDVLAWDHGSIIELDKEVGEPVNLLVNGRPVARGEVVVVNDKFALKITEILDPHSRLVQLHQSI